MFTMVWYEPNDYEVVMCQHTLMLSIYSTYEKQHCVSVVGYQYHMHYGLS